MITRRHLVSAIRRAAGITDSGPCRIAITDDRPAEPHRLCVDDRGRRLIIVARAWLIIEAERAVKAQPDILA